MTMMAWLKQEPALFTEYLILVFFLLAFGALMAGIGFIQLGPSAVDAAWRPSRAVRDHSNPGAVYKLVVFVVGEEMIYRCLPLTGAVVLGLSDWQVLSVAAVSSSIFGFVPPHSSFPVRTRIVIAFGGVILSLVYLKCGGWRSDIPLKP